MKLTKEEYETLKEKNRIASQKNDYNNMIMPNMPEYQAMRNYEQDNLCSHPDIGTNGGMDYCKICGKQF